MTIHIYIYIERERERERERKPTAATTWAIPRFLLLQSWSTSWNEEVIYHDNVLEPCMDISRTFTVKSRFAIVNFKTIVYHGLIN